MTYTNQSTPEQDPYLRQYPAEYVSRAQHLSYAHKVAKNSAAIVIRTAQPNSTVLPQREFQVSMTQPATAETQPRFEQAKNTTVAPQPEFKTTITQPSLDAGRERQLRDIRNSVNALYEENL